MPIPGQPMIPPSPAGPVPGAPPQPGAPPAAGSNPLAALAGMGGGGGMPQGMLQFLTFLAGVGFTHFEQTMNKLRNPQGKGGGKTALGKEAAGNPQQTQLGPQLLAQLAARRAQAMGGQQQPNPAMAGLMGR